MRLLGEASELTRPQSQGLSAGQGGVDGLEELVPLIRREEYAPRHLETQLENRRELAQEPRLSHKLTQGVQRPGELSRVLRFDRVPNS